MIYFALTIIATRNSQDFTTTMTWRSLIWRLIHHWLLKMQKNCEMAKCFLFFTQTHPPLVCAHSCAVVPIRTTGSPFPGNHYMVNSPTKFALSRSNAQAVVIWKYNPNVWRQNTLPKFKAKAAILKTKMLLILGKICMLPKAPYNFSPYFGPTFKPTASNRKELGSASSEAHWHQSLASPHQVSGAKG